MESGTIIAEVGWGEMDEIVWHNGGTVVCPHSCERINVENPDLKNCLYHLEQLMTYERDRK